MYKFTIKRSSRAQIRLVSCCWWEKPGMFGAFLNSICADANTEGERHHVVSKQRRYRESCPGRRRLEPDESDLKQIILLKRIARYKQTKNGVPFLDGGKSRVRHAEFTQCQAKAERMFEVETIWRCEELAEYVHTKLVGEKTDQSWLCTIQGISRWVNSTPAVSGVEMGKPRGRHLLRRRQMIQWYVMHRLRDRRRRRRKQSSQDQATSQRFCAVRQQFEHGCDDGRLQQQFHQRDVTSLKIVGMSIELDLIMKILHAKKNSKAREERRISCSERLIPFGS